MTLDLEDEARHLRDRIYGKPISDESWENVKKNWMREDSMKWLREQVEKMKERND